MHKNSSLNSIFNEMKQRCYNPKNSKYKHYGARGITICSEWNNRERIGLGTKGWYKFKEWALSNGYISGLSIDRIDNNNKGYSPENCRWSTAEEQQNNKRNNILVILDNKVLTLSQACKKRGLSYDTVSKRLKYGWSIDKALGTDIREYKWTVQSREEGL